MAIRTSVTRLSVALIALLATPACDLFVEAGQTVVLGNRGSVFGSGGNAQQAPRAAVQVQADGAVVVQDADLFGGGLLLERADQTRYGASGAAILAFRGSVRVQNGLVSGGPLVVQTAAQVSQIDPPAPGIHAVSSRIEISGGTIRGGSIVSFTGGFADGIPAAGLRAVNSRIRVSGGSFASGGLTPGDPAVPRVGFSAFDATRSDTEIGGGQFADGLGFVDGTARIFGGSAVQLSFRNTSSASCSELHGGRFGVLEVTQGRVIVFGTGLGLRSGPGGQTLTGTLEDGTSPGTLVRLLSGGRVDLVVPGSPGCAAFAATERISVGPGGVEANDRSFGDPQISSDGRFVAYISGASNLIPSDTNGAFDLFLHDRMTGTNERVNVDSSGQQDDRGVKGRFGLTADGRFVAFASDSSNLAPDEDIIERGDVFVRDRQNGTTERIRADFGSIAPEASISDDGQIVVFTTDSLSLDPNDRNVRTDVFVHDRRTRATRRIVTNAGTDPEADSFQPILSGNGRFVLFSSFANFVDGGTSTIHVFVHDLATGVSELVSKSSLGVEGNGFSVGTMISADGRVVGFTSQASNLVAGDTNGMTDGFIRDRQTGITTRVTLGPNGVEGNGGTFGVFLSRDGRFATFSSDASNLVPDDTNRATDVFVRDLTTGSVLRVSVASDGSEGNDSVGGFAASADARITAFLSLASNLVPADTNDALDVFVRDRSTQP